jgi:hypothetical protein
MRKLADSFRSAVQDMSAFILLSTSWYSIMIIPIVVIVVTAWLLLASESGVDGMYLIMAAIIVMVFCLFTAWFLRWLARGIMQGKKVRIAFSSLAGIVFALILFLSSKSMPSASSKLQVGLWAAVSFLFGFGLFLSLFKKVSSDEA